MLHNPLETIVCSSLPLYRSSSITGDAVAPGCTQIDVSHGRAGQASWKKNGVKTETQIDLGACYTPRAVKMRFHMTALVGLHVRVCGCSV